MNYFTVEKINLDEWPHHFLSYQIHSPGINGRQIYKFFWLPQDKNKCYRFKFFNRLYQDSAFQPLNNL